MFVKASEDVRVAAQEAKVCLDTTANPHPAIAGHLHHNHLIRTTGGLEGFILTVFLKVCDNKQEGK